MARVTVEDCLEHVENRFKLVLLASKRARQLALGTEPLVEWENDKPTVVALREIAKDLVNEEMMQASLEVPAEEELEFDEDDLAAALHAEISRELSQTEPQSPVVEPPKAKETPADAVQTNPIFGAGLGDMLMDKSPVDEVAHKPEVPDTVEMQEAVQSPDATEMPETPEDTSDDLFSADDSSPEGEQGF